MASMSLAAVTAIHFHSARLARKTLLLKLRLPGQLQSVDVHLTILSHIPRAPPPLSNLPPDASFIPLPLLFTGNARH
jgi:hypothetical protein